MVKVNELWVSVCLVIGQLRGVSVQSSWGFGFRDVQRLQCITVSGFGGVFIELCSCINLPLVSREWKNGSNSSYNCTPFLHSLLTKGKSKVVWAQSGRKRGPEGAP